MKDFVLELRKDFLFVGQEYRFPVGNSDFEIDLLFFHRGLQSLVAFELKAEKFKPEHLGQLNFYLEALDRGGKKEHENPGIGILLCKGQLLDAAKALCNSDVDKELDYLTGIMSAMEKDLMIKPNPQEDRGTYFRKEKQSRSAERTPPNVRIKRLLRPAA